MVFILPVFVHKADEYAQKGDLKGVSRMHYLGGFFGVNLIIGVVVAISFYVGSPAVQALLAVIPEWIQQWFTNRNGIITCNWVWIINANDYEQRSSTILHVRICFIGLLKIFQ